MPADAWITLVVLVATFAVLALERVPAAVAMGGAIAVLVLAGVIDEEQALSGFGSSAPATIAALYVLAGAATVTGAAGPLVDRALSGARSDRARLLYVAGGTAAVSAFVPNTPLVALLAPRLVTWARRTGGSAAKYLMPLSFAAVLGGVVTVIGTSTNLVVSDLLRRSGEEPLAIFEITPVGLPVALAGVAVLVLLTKRLLPDRASVESSLQESARRFTVAMRVVPGGPLVDRSVSEAGLRHLSGVFLAGLARGAHVVPPGPDTVLAEDDTLYFVGDVTKVVDLHDVAGLVSAEQPHVSGVGDRPGAQLYEAVVSERSALAGSTLKAGGFRSRYSAAVLAIHRAAEEVSGKLGTVVLRPGDVLLVLAGSEFDEQWRQQGDFSLVASLGEQAPPRRARAPLVWIAVAGLVIASALELLSLLEASVLAAGAMLALRVMSPAEARRSVNLNVVLTIALSISLGAAVGESGLADEMASLLGSVGDPFGDVGRLVAVLAATMLLTELLSNNAAAAVMFPVAVATANEAGLDPRSFAIAVLIGASCSFLSPIGYQTNLMVYGLGGYRFGDFVRLGLPVTLATLVVTPVAVMLTLGI